MHTFHVNSLGVTLLCNIHYYLKLTTPSNTAFRYILSYDPLRCQNYDNWLFLIPYKTVYNQFHILRLFDVLPNFPFNTSETMGDCYL